MADELIDMLRRARDDYGAELEYQRFLLDAYAGTGGFCGKVKTPRVGVLGSAATAYSSQLTLPRGASSHSETYLDRFPREDEDKFQRRIDVAHYDNYLGPIADLFVSYLNTGKSSYEGVPAGVEEWQRDVTGTGVSWDALLSTIVRPRAAIVGWCPVLFDRDAAPDGVEVTTKAQEQALGLRLRAVPMFPSNVLEWEVDEKTGQLVWVKLFTRHCSRSHPLESAVEYDEFRIFTRDTFSVYRVIKESGGQERVKTVVENAAHGIGQVPVVFFRAKPTPEDAVRGISMVQEIAAAQRRLFNVHSELDEHIRCNVFPILGIPMKNTLDDVGSVIGGNGVALKVPMDSNLPLHYVAPPGTVAETLETRSQTLVREIHRMARAPFENDKGGAQAADALAMKFDQTNRKIGDASASLATSEQQALRLVAMIEGGSDASEAIIVAPQREFRVDDIGTDIDNALKAVGLPGMPATAKRVVVRRVIDKMLGNLSAEERAAIDAEIKTAGADSDESQQQTTQQAEPDEDDPAATKAA